MSADRPDPSADRDWDAEFEAITAQLTDSSPQQGQAPETSRGTQSDAPSPQGSLRFNPQWRVPNAAISVGSNEFSRDADTSFEDDPEDEFVPPEPAHIDWADPYTGIMVAALVLGPVLLLYLLFFHRDASTLSWLVGVGIVIAGFVMAVGRQPHSRDEDDEDDGARV